MRSDYNEYDNRNDRYSSRSSDGERYHRESRDWASRMHRASHQADSWFGQPEPGYHHRNEPGYQGNYGGEYINRGSSYTPTYLGGTGSGFHRYERSNYGRGMYAVPGLDRDDPRFGTAEYDSRTNIYGSMGYGQSGYDQTHGHSGNYGGHYPHEDPNRGLWSEMKDEVRSWFGDDAAARRRRDDARNELGQAWYSDRRFRDRNYDSDYDYDRNRFSRW